MIRPTARLQFEIDPGLLNEDLVDDLKRCYLNVAPVFINPRPEEKDGRIAKNVLGIVVVLHYPYWNEDDERAQGIWDDVMIPWLKNKLFRVNATVQNYNTSRRGDYIPMVQYGSLEIILGKRVIAFKLPSRSTFPEEIPELLTRLRDCVLAGAFGDAEPVRIEMPWIDPTTLPEEEPEEPAEEEPVETAEEPAAEEAPTEAEDAEGAEGEGEGETGAGPEADGGEEAEPVRELEPLPEPDEPIDYTVWGVTFADGTTCVFDSAGRRRL